jgi:diadenosine tetraphosphatase ApaH/serine/threonine PP2A family protein phosphatase
MKTALLSDVHGNLEALTAVIRSLKDEGIQQLLFLGDAVGYGANPNECIELLREVSDDMLAGNHDWAAVGKSSYKEFNPDAKKAIEWTRQNLTKENRLFLSSLPLLGEAEGFLFVHATPYEPELWDYIFGTDDAEYYFEKFRHSLCFTAHSHIPVIFIQTDTGKTLLQKGGQIAIKKDFRYIINSGSIGQPRDGSPLSSYGIYDTDKKEYTLMRMIYDVGQAQEKILNAGLPQSLATRLSLGI